MNERPTNEGVKYKLTSCSTFRPDKRVLRKAISEYLVRTLSCVCAVWMDIRLRTVITRTSQRTSHKASVDEDEPPQMYLFTTNIVRNNVLCYIPSGHRVSLCIPYALPVECSTAKNMCHAVELNYFRTEVAYDPFRSIQSTLFFPYFFLGKFNNVAKRLWHYLFIYENCIVASNAMQTNGV